MKLRLQAALAAGAAAAPLGLGMLAAWAAGWPQPSGLVALTLAVLGNGLVALLWWQDVKRVLAGSPPILPAHGTLARSLAISDAAGAAARSLAEQRAAAARALLEALPDPVIALDDTRALVRANAAARALFGGSDDISALLRHPVLVGLLDRVAAGGQAAEAELALVVPADRSLAVRVVPADLTDGTIAVRRLVLLRDRTRDVALERMRADFIANASHELRTPLSSLLGFIETLRGPAEGDLPAQRRFLAIMHEQAERMRRLLDDLLSLSRIEMAEHAPPTARVSLAPLLRRAADGFEPRVAARGQTLEVAIEPGLPEVAADADQLAQVFGNLLENAVKYGREGGVVRLAARRTAAGGRQGVAIAVGDDGSGIAPEHLPRLTERFYRVDAGRSRAIGGTGLGLAIVKHIVGRHRGRLEIESALGKGSTFTVWLPAAEVR